MRKLTSSLAVVAALVTLAGCSLFQDGKAPTASIGSDGSWTVTGMFPKKPAPTPAPESAVPPAAKVPQLAK